MQNQAVTTDFPPNEDHPPAEDQGEEKEEQDNENPPPPPNLVRQNNDSPLNPFPDPSPILASTTTLDDAINLIAAIDATVKPKGFLHDKLCLIHHTVAMTHRLTKGIYFVAIFVLLFVIIYLRKVVYLNLR